ncbi:MAG: SCP2 sterol-binding domain-containing protein [Neomegalonema sp.]|nr:SCP2 sterol-binding domain-containing protein [Neomegalonema sp.]
MSDVIETAIAALKEKLGDADLGGKAKFEIEGQGAVIVDGSQMPPSIAAGDGDADVTISAEAELLADLMKGEIDPTAAYMSGKLKIDGDMGFAMKLAQMLA